MIHKLKVHNKNMEMHVEKINELVKAVNELSKPDVSQECECHNKNIEDCECYVTEDGCNCTGCGGNDLCKPLKEKEYCYCPLGDDKPHDKHPDPEAQPPSPIKGECKHIYVTNGTCNNCGKTVCVDVNCTAHFSLQPQSEDNWEKKFDETFMDKDNSGLYWAIESWYKNDNLNEEEAEQYIKETFDELKDFIRNLLAEERKRK